MTAIISRPTAKGFLEIGLDATGNFAARLGGKIVEIRATGIETVETVIGRPHTRAIGETLRRAGRTHCLGLVIGLDADEADLLSAAAKAWAQTSPLVLRGRREQLVEEIDRLLDAAHEDHVAAVERASATGRWSEPADQATEIASARAALAAFDAAHPEIVTAIEEERVARIERNLWD